MNEFTVPSGGGREGGDGRNFATSPIGSSTSSSSNVAEMSENQFNASLDALMNADTAGYPTTEGGNASPTEPTEDYLGFGPQVSIGGGGGGGGGQNMALLPDMMKAPPSGPGSMATSNAIASTQPQTGGFVQTLPGGAMQVTEIGPLSMPGFSITPYAAVSGGGCNLPGTGTATSMGGTITDQQVSFAKPPAPRFGASSSAASVASSADSGRPTNNRKRGWASASVSEDETTGLARRRQDRNLREQQRSQQITTQIAYLRDILSEAKVQFKPDKYSTLVTIGQYVKQLQQRSAMLDSEHKKLLDTISKTSELVNSHHVPPNVNSEGEQVLDGVSSSESVAANTGGEESAVFVSGLDYKSVFLCCPVACAITSIDGRFLDCNREFEDLTGFTRAELLPHSMHEVGSSAGASSDVEGSPAVAQEGKPPSGRNLSLFNVLSRTYMEKVFIAMSELLKRPYEANKAKDKNEEPPVESKGGGGQKDFWKTVVKLSKKEDVEADLNVHIVRGHQGRPKFFQTTLIQKG